MDFRPPLIKLPKKTEYCLFLIREELKTRHLFNKFQKLGFENLYLEPNLDRLILKHVGLDDGRDETYAFYVGIMERRSMKINDDAGSIMKQVMKAYVELMGEGVRRSKNVE